MIGDPVTLRYADALFDLARDKSALEDVHRDVKAISAAMEEVRTAAMIADARVPTDQKRAHLGELSASFHQLTVNFINLLLDKHRESVLHGLGNAFRRRVLESQGAVEGVVESARPLAAEELEQLSGYLGAKLDKRVLLENRTVPELVGGVRVLVAGRLLDQSVVGRLEGLRRRLKETRLTVRAAE